RRRALASTGARCAYRRPAGRDGDRWRPHAAGAWRGSGPGVPIMRYVKQLDEIARLRAIYAAPAFLDSRVLSVQFETTPETIAALLPPPLEPADRSLAAVTVMEFGASNCVGPFAGASVTVRARFRDL